MLHPTVRRPGNAARLRPALAPALVMATLAATAFARSACAQDTTPAPTTTPPATPTASTDVPPPTTTTTPPATTTTPANPAPPAPKKEDKPKKRGLQLGLEVGTYIPSSGKTADAFGKDWFNIGLGLGGIQQTRAGGHPQLDFSLITQSRSNKQVYIAPIGVAYRYGLTPTKVAGPYVGASADFMLTQIRDDDAHIVSRFRGTGGGSVFVGTTLTTHSYVQARYFALGSVRGYNFSGLNLTAGFRL